MAKTARVLSRLFLHFTLDHRGDPSCGETLHKWQPLPSSWTSRFPDPEGRESATPFPCWHCVYLSLSWWLRRPSGSAAECDGLEDLPSARTVGTAAHLARGLRGRVSDRLRGQAATVAALRGSLS